MMRPIQSTFAIQKYKMEESTHWAERFCEKGFDFDRVCFDLLRFQYHNNLIYKQYVDALRVNITKIEHIHQIPFLPIRFFKTHDVVSTSFVPELCFESSGTTHTINSRHLVKQAGLYQKSFITCFEQFYGAAEDWCIIGLLPSYLERGQSSLVYMVQQLAQKSKHPNSGFYLYDFKKLRDTLEQLELSGQKTLLIGVTFALLDFAAQYPMPLKHTVIMETGGMKGRKKEIVRAEVHEVLMKAFSLGQIHSEYGMTELLSQSYSIGDGLFKAPQWMRVLLRQEDDPLSLKPISNIAKTRGLINVIDLANKYSCGFVATDDWGVVRPDGSFEVTGRLDNSDLRGCSLLAV